VIGSWYGLGADADNVSRSRDTRRGCVCVAQGNTMGVGSLLQFTIQPDGTLTPKDQASVPTEQEIEGIAISPNGSSLYVIEGGFFGDGEVATYAIGPEGSLSATEAPKVSTGDQPFDIAVSTDGGSVYVSNWLEDTISQYNVQANGSLAPMTPETVAAGPQPYRIAIAPDGHSLYVTDEHFIVESPETREGSVSRFTIGPGGLLAPKTPAAVSAGSEPKGIVISPSGANLYIADSTETGRLSQFSIGPDGTLAPLTPPAVGAGRQPFGLAVGPDGRHLYVSNSAEYTIGEYEIADGGTLQAMAPPTVHTGEWPMNIVLVETEAEPTIAHKEPEETEPPLEHCHEPPGCREPEPPRQCREPEPRPDRCCAARFREVEPQYAREGCCLSAREKSNAVAVRVP
jgi:DNA-binding beta-propeller fold protein YncE